VCRLSNRVAFRLSDGERRSGGVDLAQDVFALGFPHVAPGILIARRQESDDGSASSRVEPKLFSVMNSVRSRKKRSTKFIQDDEVGV
jgi:hypothetical protein